MDKIGKSTLETMRKAAFYNRWILGNLKPYLKGEILEIGAGIGNFTYLLQKYGEVTAIDIQKYYISKLKKQTKNPKLAGFGDIESGTYYFGNKKFDTIVCLNVLEHINNDEKALKNMYSLLRKGGILLLLVPAHQSAYTGIDKGLGHYRRYTKKSLLKLAKEVGFVQAKARYLNILGLIGWYINGKVLKRKELPTAQVGIFDKVSLPFLFIEKKVIMPAGLSVFLVAHK